MVDPRWMRPTSKVLTTLVLAGLFMLGEGEPKDGVTMECVEVLSLVEVVKGRLQVGLREKPFVVA